MPIDSGISASSMPSGSVNWIGDQQRTNIVDIWQHPVAFRYDFSLAEAPTRAQLCIASQGNYMFWLNGIRIIDGPAAAPHGLALVDKVDIGEYLVEGANHLAFCVWPEQTQALLMVNGQIETPFGEITIASDESWYVRCADWVEFEGVSSAYSMSEEPSSWQSSPPTDEWQRAVLGMEYTPGAWPTLADRPVDRLVDKEIVAQLSWRGRGPRVIHERRGQELLNWFNDAAVAGDGIYHLEATPGRYDLTFDNIVTFDLGRAAFCRPSLCIETDALGHIAVFYHGKLGERPFAMSSMTRHGEQTCDVLELAQGRMGWTSSKVRSARYVTLLYAGSASCQVDVAFGGVEYPFNGCAEFSSSEALLEQIWQIAADTIVAATSDIYGRSVLQDGYLWPTECVTTAQAAFYTFGETALWRRCLAGIAKDLAFAPSLQAAEPPALMVELFSWVRSCWLYYMQSADISLLRDVAPDIQALLNRCSECMSERDLFCPDDISDQALSGLLQGEVIYPLKENVLLFAAAKAAARIARILGDTRLGETAQKFIMAIDQEIAGFYDVKLRRYRAYLAEGVANGILQAHGADEWLVPNMLLCREGLGPNAQRKATAASLAAACVPPMSNENRFSPTLAAEFGHVLTDYGYADSSLRFLQSIYAEQVYGGAPTFGARFTGSVSGDAFASASSINTYLVQDVVGLRPLVAGWRRVLLRPSLLLDELKYAFHSPVGKISVEIQGPRIVVVHPKGVQLECEGRVYAGTGEPQVVMDFS